MEFDLAVDGLSGCKSSSISLGFALIDIYNSLLLLSRASAGAWPGCHIMLQSIDITNFRGFRRLTLENFQPVNLIVGKNNSGKTSLLEGIGVLLNPQKSLKLFSELRPLEDSLLQVFQGGVFSSWVVNTAAKSSTATLRGDSGQQKFEVSLTGDNLDSRIAHIKGGIGNPGTAFTPQQGADHSSPAGNFCVVGTERKASDALVQSFSNAVLRRNGEESIESQLSAVDSRIAKVRVHPSEMGKNIIVVDIGLDKLVPLSQVGQGIQRLVEMFSEIIGAEAEVCFIDEIENGIHHTHLAQLWTGIAQAAKHFGVQVFATTHSYECIEAAHRAFSERQSYDFAVIQLFRDADDIQGRVLDKEHIAAGIAGEIELRG